MIKKKISSKAPVKVVEKKRKRRQKPTQLSSFIGSKRKKLPRPDRRQLKAIYKLMLNALPEARVNALIATVHWYDAALDWVRDDEKKNLKLQTVAKQRTLEAIENIREMSLNATDLTKKEDYLKKLIEKFEETLKGIFRTKTLASTYSKLSKMAVRLKKRATKLEAKYSKVIELLQNALKPKNAKGETVQFKVGDFKDGEGKILERRVSADFRSFMYDRTYAQKMLQAFKQEGLLPLAIREIPWLSRVCAFKAHESEHGKHIVDLKLEFDSIFEMMNNLISFCQANPKIGRKLLKTKRKPRKKKTS